MSSTKSLSARDFSSQKGINLVDGTVSTDAASTGQVTAAQAFAVSRANHTGTQLANTISNFDTQVRTSRLDQMTAPAAAVAYNAQKITGLLDPTAAQDAATKAYVDAQLAGVASGLVLKGSVRAATSVQTSITSAPATIDSITPAPGDVFLLMGNTSGSENGPRVWTAAGAAMARATNFATSAQATLGSFWDVREGSSADAFALLTNDTAVTLDTTALTFVIRGSSAGATGYTATCPAVSAGGTWTVTHGLNSKFLVAMLARTASPFDFVDVRIERTTLNTLSVQPDLAIVAGDYEIMISKCA